MPAYGFSFPSANLQCGEVESIFSGFKLSLSLVVTVTITWCLGGTWITRLFPLNVCTSVLLHVNCTDTFLLIQLDFLAWLWGQEQNISAVPFNPQS